VLVMISSWTRVDDDGKDDSLRADLIAGLVLRSAMSHLFGYPCQRGRIRVYLSVLDVLIDELNW
jgi:hypothetical protein